MRVLVIGSTGQLAHDLLATFGADATGLSHQDLEVCREADVARKLREARPDWVLNTAAFHRVDECEDNAQAAFAVNAIGALNVSKAANAVAAGVVYFSTDYVFSGLQRPVRQPYVETDRPEPLNVYGASKLAGEQLVMQANPRHLIVRTTGLFGPSTSRKGWTFPELILNNGRTDGRVRVVSDQVVSPTYTVDLAAKVKELLDRDIVGLMHLTNAGECSWYEFTRELFRLAGLDAAIEPITTAQSQRRALRPSYSALSSERLAISAIKPLRPWQEALAAYVQKKIR